MPEPGQTVNILVKFLNGHSAQVNWTISSFSQPDQYHVLAYSQAASRGADAVPDAQQVRTAVLPMHTGAVMAVLQQRPKQLGLALHHSTTCKAEEFTTTI